MNYNRPEGFQHEGKDCTVRAMSLVTNIPYEKVHSAFKLCGRRDGKGTNSRLSMKKVCKILNVKSKMIKRSGSVRKLIGLYPKGNIFCTKRGHAFPVIDGVPHDVDTLGSHIKNAWIITK